MHKDEKIVVFDELKRYYFLLMIMLLVSIHHFCQ